MTVTLVGYNDNKNDRIPSVYRLYPAWPFGDVSTRPGDPNEGFTKNPWGVMIDDAQYDSLNIDDDHSSTNNSQHHQ